MGVTVACGLMHPNSHAGTRWTVSAGCVPDLLMDGFLLSTTLVQPSTTPVEQQYNCLHIPGSDLVTQLLTRHQSFTLHDDV